MASSKLHRSQMTNVERALARDQRVASSGRSNLQGGTSHFLQWRGDATPTQDEMESAVKWNRGTELQGHQSHQSPARVGPDFSQLLPGLPENEAAEATGPTPLRIK